MLCGLRAFSPWERKGFRLFCTLKGIATRFFLARFVLFPILNHNILPMQLTQKQAQHLYWRAGFGGSPAEIRAAVAQDPATVLDRLFPKKPPVPVTLVTPPSLANLSDNEDDEGGEARQAMRQERRQALMRLNAAWLGRMAFSDEPLLEKMTLFWHGHFACRTLMPYLAQQQHNLLRSHALGNFGDMLREISRNPAMLQFLNNQQNRKQSPNENFAREVMELFTVGRGHYSEQDIKEAARAFTGWGFNLRGEFVFRKFFHDAGTKTFLGKSGRFDGNSILDMLLNEKQTARFVSLKIYRFLVGETPPEPALAEHLADTFFRANYDIPALLREILAADWFYAPANIGAVIKPPVVFLAGFSRAFNAEFTSWEPVLLAQRTLGQVLFLPPNVAGWPSGESWIDSSTLMFRLKLPQAVFELSDIDFQAKDDGDVNSAFQGLGNLRKFQATTNWEPLEKAFLSGNRQDLGRELGGFLLQAEPAAGYVAAKPTDTLKDLALHYTRLPEYQLC